MIRTHLTLQLTAFRWAECRWQQLRGSLYCEACRLLSTLIPHWQPPQASSRLAFTFCCAQFTARSLKCTRGEFNLLFNAILFSNQLKSNYLYFIIFYRGLRGSCTLVLQWTSRQYYAMSNITLMETFILNELTSYCFININFSHLHKILFCR